MSRPAAFPWAEAMGFAFSVLRLPPDAFWAMTPRELATAIRFSTGQTGAKAPQRAALDDLMRAFPDYPDRSGA